MYKAAIIGGTGYGGAEMCRQLLHHPEVELSRVVAVDNVGKNIGEVHYNLYGQTDLVFEEMSPQDAADGMDVVLLGLPHKVAAAIGGELYDAGVKIVDMSGDYRLHDQATYEKYYQPHPRPDLLGKFTYGLPEVNRDEIKKSQAVASPGCFATTMTLALLPWAQAGLLNGGVHVVAATGSSGSGAYASAGTHHPVRAGNLKIYSPLNHRHQPEVEQTLGYVGTGEGFHLEFVPVSAPLVRGILANAMFEVPASLSEDEVAAMYQKAFGDSKFVKIVKGRFPEVVAIAGTNYVEVGFAMGKVVGDKRSVVATAALDNLVKGGAGQAVQNMNLILGLDEGAGFVSYSGIWP
jgi:N-acetyl-gamma-glutamyl-phosphate reductase